MPLDQRQRKQVITATRARISEAEIQFNKRLPKVEISFDVRGSAWGYYMRKGRQRRIRYNAALFEKYFNEGLEDTVAHEVAHFVVDSLYRRRKTKPHGKEWREVMSLFGINNPSVTHSTDLSGIEVRQQRRFKYQCECGPVMLSTTRHFRVLRGTTTYSCRRCGNQLQVEK
ncbi:MAG TPA: metallopeptidase (SprT family) [Gammaproteobacteria bacterium]|jgi:SprT protein|nr:metallopeptidase (SprT family) [Gammaproteobacteria bacterium]